MDGVESMGEDINLWPQCPEISSDHTRKFFWNDLKYLNKDGVDFEDFYKDGVNFEDFDSYKDLKEYMRQKSWELARDIREDEERSHYSPRIVLARRMGDNKRDPGHQAIIVEEVENYTNVERNEDPKPILGHPISFNEDYLEKNSDMEIVSNTEDESEEDDHREFLRI